MQNIQNTRTRNTSSNIYFAKSDTLRHTVKCRYYDQWSEIREIYIEGFTFYNSWSVQEKIDMVGSLKTHSWQNTEVISNGGNQNRGSSHLMPSKSLSNVQKISPLGTWTQVKADLAVSSSGARVQL